VRNIFLFIRRYFNFLFFVLAQAVALIFFFRYNKFHEAAFMGVASEVTGRFNERFNNVELYFSLKKTNESLAKENAELRRQLKVNFEGPDSTSTFRTDTLLIDSVKQTRRFEYLDAKVVSNSFFSQTNTIMVHRGSGQGVEVGMAVISAEGVVGTVVNVSENFADVMSVLHKYHKISAMLKKGGDWGTVKWDGEDPQFLTMENVSQSNAVAIGDTILTSNLSGFEGTFPPGIMVGTVAEVTQNTERKYHTLKLKTATNFFNLQYVMLVKDTQRNERKKLADSTSKKVQ